MPDDTRSAAPALRLFLWSRAAIWLLALVVVLGFDGVAERSPRRVGQRPPPRPRRRRSTSGPAGTATGSCGSPSTATPGRRARRRSSRSIRSSSRASAGSCSATTSSRASLISLAAGAAAFVLLYRLTRLRLGEEAARRTVLFLAVAPTSLFFGAVYSESLFLLLAVATFLLAERGRFWQARARRPGSRSSPARPGSRCCPRSSCSPGARPTAARSLAGVAVAPLLFALYPARARDLDRPSARVPRRAEGGLGAAALARRARSAGSSRRCRSASCSTSALRSR